MLDVVLQSLSALSMAKSPALVPLMAMLLNCIGAEPLLLTLTVWLALRLPLACAG